MTQLQFITHATPRYNDIEEIRMALAGGCRWIQLRMKEASDDEVTAVGKTASRLCHEHHATLILDDRVGLCHTIGADGVHLGRHDMPIAEARSILGRHAIIGATVNTPNDLLHAAEAGADYIGCGPFRFTTTKAHLAPVLGLSGYRRIIEAKKRNGIEIPIIAIGGIRRDDIAALADTGVEGIAISGCMVNASDPVEEMKLICKSIQRS